MASYGLGTLGAGLGDGPGKICGIGMPPIEVGNVGRLLGKLGKLVGSEKGGTPKPPGADDEGAGDDGAGPLWFADEEGIGTETCECVLVLVLITES